MQNQINLENKSTKEIILDYLIQNHGREVPVSEISKKFNFKLARISNAIKELKLAREIVVERRPIKKGKYTVIWLTGDVITEFASHERDIVESTKIVEAKPSVPEEFSIEKVIKLLFSVNYDQTKRQHLLRPNYRNYRALTFDIIQQDMYQDGLLWQDQKLNVGDEHLLSGRIERFLSGIIQNQPVGTKKLVILVPSENEYHTLALKVLELLLIEHGYKVMNLSYTIDAFSLISFIKQSKLYPDWIFFSLTMDYLLPNLRIEIKIIREELQMTNLKIAIGGQGINGIDPDEFKEADKVVKTKEGLQEFLLLL